MPIEYSGEDIRLNVEVPKSLNDEVNSLLPRGTKSEVVRGLLRMLVRELKSPKSLIVLEALLRDTAVVQYDERLLPSHSRYSEEED